MDEETDLNLDMNVALEVKELHDKLKGEIDVAETKLEHMKNEFSKKLEDVENKLSEKQKILYNSKIGNLELKKYLYKDWNLFHYALDHGILIKECAGSASFTQTMAWIISGSTNREPLNFDNVDFPVIAYDTKRDRKSRKYVMGTKRELNSIDELITRSDHGDMFVKDFFELGHLYFPNFNINGRKSTLCFYYNSDADYEGFVESSFFSCERNIDEDLKNV
ncbi:hypothetical protein HOK51_00320 [Candidatus Woesearchaeota archaeon]|jgi:hypothetical protein|nr:hypothetical protein [Candidatus Woesearchaeota archaeon]MBT6518257.1 hypothetical protein [Candidatus Woesearchaeota archaeon]MBT7368060.1 hypothetical protein [Candidatus Woesearchaeota archaeon]